MKINRRLQYGLLLAVYLSRSGRSTIDTISKNIDVPKDFLEQIARDLRVKGVLKSIRGPHGGYELAGEPTVAKVVYALEPVVLMSQQEVDCYKRGELEHRALASVVADMFFSLHSVLHRPVRDIVRELVAAEKYLIERAEPCARAN